MTRRFGGMRIILACAAAGFVFNAVIGTPGVAAGPKKVKNVLYIISDDLKASTLGCYGDTICETPNVDRLAREGMVFTRAYSQGVVCAPSRPSIMYSRYKEFDDKKLKSFPQFFKEKGWYSARVSKIFHMPIPRAIVEGTDGTDYPASWTERFNCQALEEASPGAYACFNTNFFTTGLEGRAGAGTADRMYVEVRADGDGSNQPDHMAASKTIELLRKKKDESFVLAVGFVRPHYPMVAPTKYFAGYRHEDVRMPERRRGDWDDIPEAGIPKFTSASSGLDKYPENQKRMWTAYYGSISFMDAQLGRVLDELDRLGLRENTAIVFTSDHGYHLGEHDFWQKANLHEEVTRVPLIVSAPGYEPGTSDAIVELADIYPTVVDLAGFKPPEECHGRSLVPVLSDPKASVRDYAFSYHRQSGANGIRGDRWTYISYGDKGEEGEELYDMKNDPGQFTNLAKRPEQKKVLARCRRVLKKKLAIK